jgi:hypothetical protein
VQEVLNLLTDPALVKWYQNDVIPSTALSEAQRAAHGRRLASRRARIGTPTSFEIGEPIEGAVFEHVSH